MIDWETLPLGDVLSQIRTGSTPPTSHSEYFGGDIPWFTPGDIGSSRRLDRSARTITSIAVSAGEAQLFPRDTLLVTCIGEIGRVGVLQQPSYCNQQITALKFKDSIDSDFAYYWFVSNRLKLANLANQAILPILNNGRLIEIEFSYPPLAAQKRIAGLLGRADRLRRLRRTARELGDSLVQSVFLEMFGDPAVNDRGWELVRLGDRLTFMTNGSRGWAEHYSDSGELFLRIQNVGANELLLDDVAYVTPPDNSESRRTRVQGGDLLISATADLGRTAVIPAGFPTAYINQHLFLLRLQNLNPIFVAGYFSTTTGKAQILRLDREGVKSGLNFDDVRSLIVFNPPPGLQMEFANMHRRAEGLRRRQREAERQTEELFEGMMEEVFGGT